MKTTIFNYGEKNGLSNFETDVVTLLIKDNEFFEKYINHLDQNTFNFEEFRQIVGMMKDAYNLEGLHLSPDVLYMRKARNSESEMNLLEFKETLELCKNNNVTAERKKEIEAEIDYWTLFCLVSYATNHAYDRFKGHDIPNYKVLETVARRLIEDTDKVKACLDSISPETSGGHNDWD